MSGHAQGGSLLVAGFETWPTSPLGTYTIAGENFDLGNPTALTRAIEQVSLDGERISGRRSSNRLVKLVIVIRADTRRMLDVASGALEAAINADTWQVQWTPPQLTTELALPVIYEAYRAVTTIDYNVELLDPAYVNGAGFVRAIYIEAPAFPFGKTPTPINVAGAVSVTVIDGLNTGPGGSPGGWRTFDPAARFAGDFVANVSDKTEGTQSWDATETTLGPGWEIGLVMAARTFPGAPINLVATGGSLALDAKFIYAYSPPTTWTLHLRDVSGFEATSTVNFAPSATWQTIVWPLSSFVTSSPGYDLSHINAWWLTSGPMLLNEPVGGPPPAAPVLRIDNLRSFPLSSQNLIVTNGGTYRFAGIPGTARANVALVASGLTFGALIAHRAPAEARPDYTPLVPLAPTTAPPYTVNLPAYNGSTSGQRWNGTHAIWLSAASLNGTGSRTVTVTFTQTSVGSVSIARTFTPAEVAGSNNMILLGTVNLPYRGQPDGMTDLPVNSGLAWTVTISDTNTADRFNDMLVLDVRGPTVVVTDGLGNTFIAIDEPSAASGIGNVYVGGGTTSLFAAPDKALITGGPFTFEPGDNIVVFYSPAGAPTVSATFSPRWLSTRSI